MRLTILLLCISLGTGFFTPPVIGQDRTSVTLLTGDPGSNLYSYFGHTGIRVTDSVRGTDVVYNYGVFDFNTPNFYLKFIRGKLLYQLDVFSWDNTLREYLYTGRRLTEQPLNLDPQTKARLLTFLQRNALPQNRSYLYDFFYDNCATRVRDVFEYAAEGALSYPADSSHNDSSGRTFRDALHRILQPHPWTIFGIDLLLGLPADRLMDYRHEMFLPDALSANLTRTTIDGTPVAGLPEEILPASPSPVRSGSYPLNPTLIFALLALTAMASVVIRPGWWPSVADRVLDIFSGLGGLLLLFLWIGTDHGAVKTNLNILMLNPLMLVSGLWFSRPSRVITMLRVVIGSLALAAGSVAPMLPQDIHPAAACWGITVGVRLLSRAFSEIPEHEA